METLILSAVAFVLLVGGYGTFLYSRVKYRTAVAPGLAPTWKSAKPKREWFSSERGWRLQNIGRWFMFFGGLVLLFVGLVLDPL